MMATKIIQNNPTILLSSILFILTACQPNLPPQQASEPAILKASEASEASEASVPAEPIIQTSTTCVNLHRVRDMDDLMKQMYDNINTQCLFETPVSELEQIWGIRIFDFTEFDSQDVEKLSKKYPKKYKIHYMKFLDLMDKSVHHAKYDNAIYLEKNTSGRFQPSKKNDPNLIRFEIHTTDAYQKQYSQYTWFSGSVDLGQFPKYLPEPDLKLEPDPNAPPELYDFHTLLTDSEYAESIKLPKNTVYRYNSNYFWVNQKKSARLPALVIYTSYTSSKPYQIALFNFYRPTRGPF